METESCGSDSTQSLKLKTHGSALQARHTLVEQMDQARRAFGWDHYSDTGTLTLGDGGFTFSGTPSG